MCVIWGNVGSCSASRGRLVLEGCTRRSAVDVCSCVQWFVGQCCKGIYLLNSP